jgi:poly(A) polymerase
LDLLSDRLHRLLVQPHKFQKCTGFFGKAGVHLGDAREGDFGELEMCFCDATSHGYRYSKGRANFLDGRAEARYTHGFTMLVSVEQLFAARDDAALSATVRANIQSDPATILRIAQVISRTGQPAPLGVSRACREELGLLHDIDRDQFRELFGQCLLGRSVDIALEWLREIGVTAMFLPELDATKDLAQEAGRRHKDVWEHTKLVVKQSVRRPEVRWAALLHDIGKVPTRTFTNKGVHFHGHAEVGARMFDKIARRIPFPPELRKAIRFLIKHHLRSNQYSASWTDGAVRRFDREMGEYLTDLLDLSRADITSQRPGRRQALLREIHNLSERIHALRAADAKVPPLHKGIGTAIMEHFDLPPSKQIGELKQALEQAIDRGELEPHRDDSYYLSWLDQSGLLTAADPTGDGPAGRTTATNPPSPNAAPKS